MFNLGFPELMVILVIALIVFGPGKMPELGNSLGKAIRGFKKAMSEEEKDSTDSKKPDQH
jgi:sec-independent protein translocase protein TatA